MQHFINDDQMNIFRFRKPIPSCRSPISKTNKDIKAVSWQYLVNNNLGGTLDATNFGKYDLLMQTCLATSSYCAIDIHNFARYNGGIIGQGGPTDAQFSSLWSQLATKYESNSRVVFGLMNEPHDLDIPTWANSVQAAVTAIRNTGATTQMILLPGSNFTSAGVFVENGSGAALTAITNPDGSTTGLILDVHKYLDVDNSGEHAECTTDNIASAFAIVAEFLRQHGRQAMVSETGAGSTASVRCRSCLVEFITNPFQCFTDFCAQNTFLNQNSDVFLGYIGWGAGSFSNSYVLSLTPTEQNGKFVDNALCSQCVVAPFLNAATTTFGNSAVAAGTTISMLSATVTSEATASATTAAPSSTTTSSLLMKPSETPSGSTENTGKATVTTFPTKSSDSKSPSATASPSSTSSETSAPALSQSTAGAGMRRFAGGMLAGCLVIAYFL